MFDSMPGCRSTTRIVFEWSAKPGLVESDTAKIDVPRKDPLGFERDGTSMYRVQPVTSTRLDGEFTSIDGTSSGTRSRCVRSAARFALQQSYSSTMTAK